MKTLAVLCLAAVCTAASGCNALWQEEFVPPQYDIRDHSIIVVKFKEDKLWYGESPLGEELHLRLLFTLQECDGVEIAANPEAEDKIYDCLDAVVPWVEIGEEAGAEIIVSGTIHDLSFQQKGMIGMLMGKVQYTLEAVDTATGKTFRYRSEVQYPKDPDAGLYEIDFEQYKPVLRQRLFKEVAKEISAKLCGELVDKR